MHPLTQAIARERHGSTRRRDLERYQQACTNVSWLLLSMDAFAAWVRSAGQEEQKFDILQYLARWMEAREIIDRMTSQPLDLSSSEYTIEDAVYTREDMANILCQLDGHFWGAERHNGEWLQRVIAEAINRDASRWVSLINSDYLLGGDDPSDFWEAVELRDTLEYALSASAFFQLEIKGRLPQLQIKNAQIYLRRHDPRFREVMAKARRAGWVSRNHLAPESFWWHR